MPVFQADGVVGLAATHGGKGKTCAEFQALAGRDGKHQVSQFAFHAVKPRLADACGQAGDDGLQHAAHAVAFTAGGTDGLLHGGLLARIQQGKMAGLRFGQ